MQTMDVVRDRVQHDMTMMGMMHQMMSCHMMQEPMMSPAGM
jgi:hypothetical protein